MAFLVVLDREVWAREVEGLRAGDFFAEALLAVLFLTGDFRAAVFLAGAFLAGALFAGVFFTAVLRAGVFLAGALRGGAFFAAGLRAGMPETLGAYCRWQGQMPLKKRCKQSLYVLPL